MYTKGFISLHRKFLDWEWYDDNNVKILFIHLLLTANWTESEWHGMKILPGQKITSLENLAKETNLTVKQVRIALNKLKRTGEVATKGTNKYTLVTIGKYEFYQSEVGKRASKRASNRTNKGQQYNNINNKLNKIKLNNLYKYIKGEEKNFDGLSEKELLPLRINLKHFGLYSENLNENIIPEDILLRFKLETYAIVQLYLSPYKVYLNVLSENAINRTYLSAMQYCPPGEDDYEEFMNYFIVCLRKECEDVARNE